MNKRDYKSCDVSSSEFLSCYFFNTCQVQTIENFKWPNSFDENKPREDIEFLNVKTFVVRAMFLLL